MGQEHKRDNKRERQTGRRKLQALVYILPSRKVPESDALSVRQTHDHRDGHGEILVT